MLQELLANAFAGHIVGMLGIQGIVGLAAAGLVGWKLMAGAKKPILLLALLAIGGCFAWKWLPFNWGDKDKDNKPGTGTTVVNSVEPSPVKPLRKYQPIKKGEPPLPARTYAEVHKPSIDGLERKRIAAGVKKFGAWPPPKEWREKNLALALAKEKARKDEGTLIAQAEKAQGFRSVPPAPPAPPRMTPDQARALAFDMQAWRLDEVQALSLRMQRKYGQPTLYAGSTERRWR